VYFTTKTCVVCKAQQEPALAALQRHAADVRVERHDAIEERELADEYGVLSVPTTAVYDRDGRLVTVNRGFTPAAVLLAQIEGREPRLEGGALMASETLIRAS
jgi:thiol-disulfide isomerase/thioredoxin